MDNCAIGPDDEDVAGGAMDLVGVITPPLLLDEDEEVELDRDKRPTGGRGMDGGNPW
jgi:hypothetical protein